MTCLAVKLQYVVWVLVATATPLVHNTHRLLVLLLWQSFAAGVGNWMADEVLYHARLHPEQLVGVLGEEQLGALHGALVKVIQVSTEAEFNSSKYPADWMFHIRCALQAQLFGLAQSNVTCSAAACLGLLLNHVAYACSVCCIPMDWWVKQVW
jgi:formamidopyrimidine-DNA glycosylase